MGKYDLIKNCYSSLQLFHIIKNLQKLENPRLYLTCGPFRLIDHPVMGQLRL